MSAPLVVSIRADPVRMVSRSGAGFGPDFTRMRVIRPLPGTTEPSRLLPM